MSDLVHRGDGRFDLQATIEWYNRLPGVTVAVGALISDDRGNVLVAQPAYKTAWVLIGGTVDAGESPVAGLRRELLEELGSVASSLAPRRLLVTDWIPPKPGWDRPMCHLVFDCGTLLDWNGRLEPATPELRQIQFLPVALAQDRMAEFEARRLNAAVEARRLRGHFYAEDGSPIDAMNQPGDGTG